MTIRLLDAAQAELWRETMNKDGEFKLLSRDMTLSLLLELGPERRLIVFRDGKMASIGRYVALTEPVDVTIKGSTEFWQKLLMAIPPPRFQNLYAGVRFGTCEVSGNAELYFAYHRALIRLIEALREFENQSAGSTPATVPRLPPGTVEQTIGRYVYLDIQGIQYRVYFEEAGKGIPMVCQHTAGSDGQQFRQFLNDPDITAKCRVIVPDLPYHGKSLPPEGIEWWAKEYRLTKSFFVAFHLALKRALKLDRPVIIGSSMGGSIATDLALECPDDYRAAIGLEEGVRSGKATDADIMAGWRYYRHPRVNGAERAAASMYCISGPNSPKRYRHEVAWGYSQGAPGVFAGDLYYRHIEHDLRDMAHRIDTKRCPVYIMNGEYDPGTGFKEGEDLAARINGAKFIPMYGLGHFPMAEDFQAMKPYLMPVLDEIAARVQ
jgi:pimeloyl-ACP methyl ester carboxylesterase